MISTRLPLLCAASVLVALPLSARAAVQAPAADAAEGTAPARAAQAGRPATPRVAKTSTWSVTVRWKRLAGSASYVVFANGSRLAQTRGTSAKLTDLKCQRRYRIAVAAVDTAGRESAKSRAVSATTGRCPGFATLLRSDMTQRSESLPHGLGKMPFSRKPRLGDRKS